MALRDTKRRKPKFKPPALMLTSMMDMFTIILIFLLCSFSDNPENLNLSKDLDLPKSSSEADYSKAIKVVLSKNELRLEDEVMAVVDKGLIKGLSDGDPKGSSFFNRLQAFYEARVESQDDQPREAQLLFMCDKSHSFKTINTVIKTAGMAGYPNFQFAVLPE